MRLGDGVEERKRKVPQFRGLGEEGQVRVSVHKALFYRFASLKCLLQCLIKISMTGAVIIA